jgi:hypothetical protein
MDATQVDWSEEKSFALFPPQEDEPFIFITSKDVDYTPPPTPPPVHRRRRNRPVVAKNFGPIDTIKEITIEVLTIIVPMLGDAIRDYICDDNKDNEDITDDEDEDDITDSDEEDFLDYGAEDITESEVGTDNKDITDELDSNNDE